MKRRYLDIDAWTFLASATVLILSVFINGFPFMITDWVRYVGEGFGDQNAPVLLNFLSRPLYTLFGFWGTALLNIFVTSYSLARIAALQLVPYSRVVILVSLVLSNLFVFAGLIGTEVWLFCAVTIIASIALGRPWTFLDVILVSVGAVVANSHAPVIIGLLILGVIFRSVRAKVWVLLFISILCGQVVNDGLFKMFHPNDVSLRYSFVAAEWLTRVPTLLEGFCGERPTERICEKPYYSFMLQNDTSKLNDIRYLWGPSSLFRSSSALPKDERFTAAEFESTAKDIVFYSVWHPQQLIVPTLQKLYAYWYKVPPGIWFNERHLDAMVSKYGARFEPYLRSIQKTGLLYSYNRYGVFMQIVFRTSLVLYFLAIVWFIARRNKAAVIWALIGGAAIIMNLAVVTVFGAVSGRYVFKLLFIPVFLACGMVVDLVLFVLAEVERQGWSSRSFLRALRRG